MKKYFNYLQTNKNEIEKLYGKKLHLLRLKGKVGKAKRYMMYI